MPHNIEEEGDALAGKHVSAAEKLARFNLIKAKLEAAESTSERVRTVLGVTSEKERIEYGVLTKIAAYGESSPEYAQLMRITGLEDRLDIANYIAEQIWKRESNKHMFAKFTPDTAAAEIGTTGGGLGARLLSAVGLGGLGAARGE